MQEVGLVAIFQSVPKEAHVHAIKRIFIYIIGTLEFGLWNLKGEDFIGNSYTDADWVGIIDDRKSTSGGLFLGKYLISWLSKNQSLISLSTIEDEYITTTSCCTQVLWMIKTLQYIKV